MRLFLSVLLLTSLCLGQEPSGRVLALNPTAHPRQQVIVFGLPKGTAPKGAQVLMGLPTVDICTARVFIPPMHNGYVKVEADELSAPKPGLGFDFSKTLTWQIRSTTDAKPFKELAPLASNPQMLVRHYIAKDEQGMVGHLLVYQGFGEDWCRYEFVMALESLKAASKKVEVGISVTRKEGDLIRTDRLLGEFSKWKGYAGTLRDRQGFCSFGAVSAPAGSGDSDITISTKKAVAIWEVTSCGHFDKWGPWATPPGGSHTDRRVALGLLDHRGVILNKRPGDTGEQFGFGVVKHLDAIRPGQLQHLAHDRAAVLQEACRPFWLFDADGSLPTVKKHKGFVSWDETWHWASHVGTDHFRRDYKHGGWYDGWTGMDRQHYSIVPLSEDVLLRGGFLSKLILEMKGFHWLKEVGYPSGGRALGRYMFAARDFWLATGDKRYIETVKEKWLPGFKRAWAATNGHWVTMADLASKEPLAMRLIKGDPHTKIPGFEWVVWEDGISIQGLDVLWPLLNDPEIKLATFLLARSVVNHGFAKNGRIYKAIRWNGPRKPLGPELATSVETNYSEWAIPALVICTRLAIEFGDKETAAKAVSLLKPMLHGGYANLDSYLGTMQGRR